MKKGLRCQYFILEVKAQDGMAKRKREVKQARGGCGMMLCVFTHAFPFTIACKKTQQIIQQTLALNIQDFSRRKKEEVSLVAVNRRKKRGILPNSFLLHISHSSYHRELSSIIQSSRHFRKLKLLLLVWFSNQVKRYKNDLM